VIRDALNLEAGVEVSLARAREVKHVVGCVALPSDPDDLEVTGRDRTCGLPRKVNVPRALIYECLEAPLQRLEELLRGVLDQLSPLVCKDIQTDGLALAGGGAMLNGLPEHLERKLGMRFIRVPDPIHCAVLGALEVSEDQCEQPRH
jgi:rod shape-determining protein MreB